MRVDVDFSAIQNAVTGLIGHTATRLPPDVLHSLRAAREREAASGHSRMILQTLLENAGLAATGKAPLCQDTGTLTFYGRVPPGWDPRRLEKAVHNAVRAATRRGSLRRNTIDAVTGAPVNDNVAPPAAPVCHWEPARRNTKRFELRLLMKGGGCENVSAQYSLPDPRLSAGRDLEGVRRCILDAVINAQGYGCAPGILGVCIGGDRATGYDQAKRLFLRPLTEPAADPVLAALEQRTLREANTLNIGPMGLGGKITLLDVKITGAARLPASFFVTVAYMCWALRRGEILIQSSGTIDRLL